MKIDGWKLEGEISFKIGSFSRDIFGVGVTWKLMMDEWMELKKNFSNLSSHEMLLQVDKVSYNGLRKIPICTRQQNTSYVSQTNQCAQVATF